MPKPFQTGSAPPPVERTSEKNVTWVNPIVDAPTGISMPLAQAVAGALRAEDIPATTDDEANGAYLLRGRVKLSSVGGAAPDTVATLVWTLATVDGTVLDEFSQPVTGTADEWWEGDPRMIARLANATSDRIARAIFADSGIANVETAAGQGAPPEQEALTVSIAELTGLDDDRRAALDRAIRYALSEIGAKPVAGPDGMFVVSGKVTLGTPVNGQQSVAVAWRVNDADGKELGRVIQENHLPVQISRTQWGEIAASIASGATEGIADLINRSGG